MSGKTEKLNLELKVYRSLDQAATTEGDTITQGSGAYVFRPSPILDENNNVIWTKPYGKFSHATFFPDLRQPPAAPSS